MLKWGIHDEHYFLGYGPKLFEISIRGIKVSVGLFIPFFPFARIYKFQEGKKERVTMTWEFFDFPLKRRLIIICLGLISLVLSGVLIFIVTSYFQQESYISKAEVNRLGIYPSEMAKKAGFEKGDRILAINGKEYDDFYELITPTTGTVYTILRDEETLEITIDSSLSKDQTLASNELFLYLEAPFEIFKVNPYSPAENAGITAGDRIRSINSKPIIKYLELQEAAEADEDGSITLEVERGNEKNITTFTATVQLDFNKSFGFFPREFINYSVKERSIIDAVIYGIQQPFKIMSGVFKLTKGATVKAGPIQGDFGEATWNRFWTMTASLAIMSLFYNIMPFPGSILWAILPLVYESIYKNRFSFERYNKISNISYYLLIGFMVWIFAGDLIKIFFT